MILINSGHYLPNEQRYAVLDGHLFETSDHNECIQTSFPADQFEILIKIQMNVHGIIKRQMLKQLNGTNRMITKMVLLEMIIRNKQSVAIFARD